MINAFSKIVLNDDLIVYRGLTSDLNSINLKESGSIISTSIKIDDAYNFLNSNYSTYFRRTSKLKDCYYLVGNLETPVAGSELLYMHEYTISRKG